MYFIYFSGGKYRSNTEDSCTVCPIGKILNDESADATAHNEIADCVECAEFTYQNLPGKSICFDCPGLDAGATGQSICPGYCSPGTKKSGTQERNGVTVSMCVNCESGKYSDKPERSTCKICPAGYHARSVEAGAHVDCQACAKGRHGNDESGGTESSVCVDCTAGKYNPIKGLNKGPCSPCSSGTIFITTRSNRKSWMSCLWNWKILSNGRCIDC